MRRTAGTIMNFLNSDKNLVGIIRSLIFVNSFVNFIYKCSFSFLPSANEVAER